MKLRAVEMLGVRVDALTFAESLLAADELIRLGKPAQHCCVNAAKVVMLNRDPRLREIVNSCAMVNADGQSLVWAARLLGLPVTERVAGIDLFRALLQLAELRGHSVFFLGARETVVQAVVARVRRDHPDLVVAGSRNGYWSPAEVDDVVTEVARTNADILFVGMPSPRKEYWLAEYLPRLNTSFAMGVGGSFDVYAGVTRRAPRWMQRAGLEWFYRLIQEPRRMGRRYLVGNTRFVLLVLSEWRNKGSSKRNVADW